MILLRDMYIASIAFSQFHGNFFTNRLYALAVMYVPNTMFI